MESTVGLNYRIPVPKNRWNREQRIFLCCLHEFFKKDQVAFKDIFNHAFRSDVRECGLVKGISWSALSSQWAEMVRYSYTEWKEVHQASFDGSRRWRPVLSQIRNTARYLGIHIVPKYTDENDTPSSRQTPSAIEPSERSSSTQDQDISLCNGGGKVCFWCAQEETANSNDEMPRFLYRWSNIDSQGVNSKKLFLAGLFADGREQFSPKDISKEQFSEYFLRHAHIEKTPSPFISTFISMLSPVHRALRNKEGAIISIIDTTKLDTALYSAKDIFRKHNLRIRGYDGRGEYLISTVQELAHEFTEIGKFLQLKKIAAHKFNRRKLHGDLARGAGNLDRASGFAIGKFLLSIGLPFEYRKDRTGTWESFHEGVDAGYGRSPRPSPASVHDAEGPEPVDYDISDDDSVTECGSISDDTSDSESEDIAANTPGDHVSERTPYSTPPWSLQPSIKPDRERISGEPEYDMLSESDYEQPAEPMVDWPEEDAQELFPRNTLAAGPVIEIFEPNTGRWVHGQSESAKKLDTAYEEQPMQPSSSHITRELRAMSVIDSDMMFDIETRHSTMSMSRELSEELMPQHQFARDRERRRLWLL
ncbi:uncharacterized protein BO80DRAFT_496008 [Aspergillus ibericus CBS 121593]|uniref:DUF7587 domain-containing protein n=1 Tax=Aspergillus ibericus CBS 121593 TaxID=1448316 RepID=A0A395GQL2_9EURO|nr:hypothetical protein BO80DRAFT_496008 [Aspergillus ibericus CBS 121593]RAK97830.1 hypothetical protein BO80DRAFT_496008 [Aspergillus ibericus CBS 121593]